MRTGFLKERQQSMKDFSEYINQDEYPNRRAYGIRLKEEIDNAKLTQPERLRRYSEAEVQTDNWYKGELKKYNHRQTQLTAMFWADCREDLEYDKFLNEKGCSALESYAYNRAHSDGYSEVYDALCDLISLAQDVIANQRTTT